MHHHARDHTTVERAATLIAAARDAHPGWSAPYGGPEGVAAAATATMRDLRDLTSDLSNIRAAAIHQLLDDNWPLRRVAELLQISTQAAYKLLKADYRTTFTRLHDPKFW